MGRRLIVLMQYVCEQFGVDKVEFQVPHLADYSLHNAGIFIQCPCSKLSLTEMHETES